MEKMIKFLVQGSGKELYITKEFLEINYTQKGGYTGTAQEIDDRVVSALGKEDGKFPLTEAVKGNVYYFPGNKKFYICKEAQNRRVSVPDGNFEELSIWENRKRLENLIGVIEVDNQNFSIKINYLKERNLILSGNFICKKEFRIPVNGQLDVLNTSMTLNGNIQAIVLGNNGNNFYKTIKISIENGKIISDVSNFTLYVF